MLSLYEILKASKTGIAPDMWTALAGANFGGAGSGAEVKELTGILPLSFTADGTPLLDYLISGNMEQSGTPTHTTPIQPSECGELEENVAIIDNKSDTINNGYYKDIRLTDVLKAGTYTVSYSFNSRTGDAYTSSIGRGNSSAYLRDIVDIFVQNIPAKIARTVTLTKDECIWARFLRSVTPSTFSYNVSNIRVEEGNVSYGIKIPISSADTTTPVYLGEVESTRQIKKLVLTGTNADGEWKKSSTRIGSFYLTIGTNATVALGLCDRAVNVGTIEQYNSIGKMFVEASGPSKLINLWLFDTNISLDDFKSYLAAQYSAGHPVTVWYVLATPTTGIVNEPLRKIGDYADTLSMEQAGVSIPTLHGNTVIDVMTELKPSEMYIKYKG